MCEYCLKRANNKGIKDVDNDDTEFAQVVILRPENPLLYVEIEGEDEDGYKPSDFFPINYCPMCGRKLDKEV